jgi:hypothetical protein
MLRKEGSERKIQRGKLRRVTEGGGLREKVTGRRAEGGKLRKEG